MIVQFRACSQEQLTHKSSSQASLLKVACGAQLVDLNLAAGSLVVSLRHHPHGKALFCFVSTRTVLLHMDRQMYERLFLL